MTPERAFVTIWAISRRSAEAHNWTGNMRDEPDARSFSIAKKGKQGGAHQATAGAARLHDRPMAASIFSSPDAKADELPPIRASFRPRKHLAIAARQRLGPPRRRPHHMNQELERYRADDLADCSLGSAP